MQRETMDGNRILKDLMWWSRASIGDIVVPNYFLGRYECDLLKISRAEQLTEYEIKVSRADFKKDFEKRHSIWSGQYETLDNGGRRAVYQTISKHDHIIQGKRCNRFYFVTPSGLIQPKEVPDGFGLIYAEDRTGRRLSFQIVKMSKHFKGQFCSENLYRHIACNLVLKLESAKERAHAAASNYRQLLKEAKNASQDPTEVQD